MAAIADTGCVAAFYGRMRVRASDEITRRIADFAARRLQRLELTLSEGGWLRLRRARGGHTLFRFRLGRTSIGAALEGRVCLEDKSAEACCRELAGLL